MSSERIVKDIRRATRKQYSAEEKIRIVLDGLRGEHSVAVDAAYLRSLLDKIDGPVILAAHSYGGAVITQAGDDPKVKGLVYAASIMPAVGESSTNSVVRFPGSTFFTSVEEITHTLPDGTSGTYLLYQSDKVHSETAADVPADVAALMNATQRPCT
jgi:pimeloyl-ACP methyl ester carboxylesterase